MVCSRLGVVVFPAVVSRLLEPRVTSNKINNINIFFHNIILTFNTIVIFDKAMVFSSGKFIITGASSEHLGILACHKLTAALSQTLQKTYRVMNLDLVNLVKSCNLVI